MCGMLSPFRMPRYTWQELELIRKGYRSVIPQKFRWSTWAADPEGITGDPLIRFIDHPTERKVEIKLAPTLVTVRPCPKRAHQGWRYLDEGAAPLDLDGEEDDGVSALPPALGERATTGSCRKYRSRSIASPFAVS